MKRKSVIIIIVIVVIILIAISAWLIYRKYFKKEEFKDDYVPPVPDYSGGTSYVPASFPIKKGMRGQGVVDVQNAINKKCNKGLITDGEFGPKTEAALKSCYNYTTVNESLYTQMKMDLGGASANVGGFVAGAKVYLKSDSVNVYSYPSFNTSYLLGTLKKSFFLDKPVGQYLGPASTSFAKIKIGAYKRLSGSDMIGVKDVYVKDIDIQKSPY